MMTYDDALKYIKDTGRFGSKLGLEVMTDLLGKMGNPEKKFKAVHIAGTNGKGSASAYIITALSENGYKTGLFTSPPIIDEMERIQIDGEYIDCGEFAEITEYVKAFADTVEADGLHYPTEFELFTAIAFYKNKRVGANRAYPLTLTFQNHFRILSSSPASNVEALSTRRIF